MSDLETRLRLFDDPRLFYEADALMHEAADAIAALQAQLAELDEKYKQCHHELLSIHKIASLGWASVLQFPITPDDSMTVRDVKVMALELLKYQDQLVEHDKTILEQQYQLGRAFSMLEVQGVSKERAKYVSTGIHVLATRMQKEITAQSQTILEQQAGIAELESKNATFVDMVLQGDDLVLEAALKAERIKTLEDIANNFEQWSTSYCGVGQERIFSSYSTELRRMANELKK